MLNAYRDRFDALLLPVARRIADLGVSPNSLTVLGLVASVAVTASFIRGELAYALGFMIAMSILDVVDGAVARISGKATDFGSFLDSLLDRYADALILLGLMIYLNGHYLLILVVLVGTILVSYSRAKAEALGHRADVGIAERAERLIILMLAVLLEIAGYNAIYPALILLAVLTHLTVLQRTLYVRSGSRWG